jgi:hypothetical protein
MVLCLGIDHVNMLWLALLEFLLQIATAVLVLAKTQDLPFQVFESNVIVSSRVCSSLVLL